MGRVHFETAGRFYSFYFLFFTYKVVVICCLLYFCWKKEIKNKQGFFGRIIYNQLKVTQLVLSSRTYPKRLIHFLKLDKTLDDTLDKIAELEVYGFSTKSLFYIHIYQNKRLRKKNVNNDFSRWKEIEGVVQRFSVKKVFLEISQNSQKETLAQVKFLRTPFFIEHLWWLRLKKYSREIQKELLLVHLCQYIC